MGFEKFSGNEFAEMDEVRKIPGMISAEECRYLYTLASERFSGSGHIVEVGSWLGKSASCLAVGLAESGYDNKIHCYDSFRWSFSHARKAARKGYGDGARYLWPYQDYVSAFEANTHKYRDRIVAHKTRIEDMQWCGEPIEILFLDAPKQFETMLRTLSVLGPHLIPGRSIVVLQDYLYFPAYPVALLCHALEDKLRPLHSVRNSSTVSYMVTTQIDDVQALAESLDYRRWDNDRHDRAWDRILGQLDEQDRERLTLGRVLSLYDCSREDDARRLLEQMDITAGQVKKVLSVKDVIGIYYPDLVDMLIPKAPAKSRIRWRILRTIKRPLNRLPA